jgi:DNA-binding transcriptional LysR family regulator
MGASRHQSSLLEEASVELRQVRYFIALARTLNFTRAAEECNVTQPALTRAIQALEAELGGELIRRERQFSHLTELGNRMLPLLQKCYESAVSAKELAQAVKKQEVAPLSIVISRTVNMTLFTAALKELSRAFPGIQLKLRRGTRAEIAKLLKDGEVELALAGPIEAWDRLDSWPLFAEPYELMFHPDHAFAARIDAVIEVKALDGERLMLRADCEMADELLARLREFGINVADAYQLENDQDVVVLLEANLGVAVVPESNAKNASLRHAAIKDFGLERPVAIYGVAGRRRSPMATSLLNLLRASDWRDAAKRA